MTEKEFALHDDSNTPGSSNLAAALMGIAADTAALDSTHQMMQQSLERAVVALPHIDAGMLWMHEPRTDRLRLTAICHMPLDAQAIAALKQLQFMPGESLVGRAFQNSEGCTFEVVSNYDQMADRLRATYRDILQQVSTQMPHGASAFYVPLRTPESTIGVLVLLHVHTPAAQSSEQATTQPEGAYLPNTYVQTLRQTLPTFARLLATLIKSNHDHEQTQYHRNRLDAFDAVVTAISTATDLQDLLRSVLDVILEVLPLSSGAIFLLEPTQARLTLGTHQGLPPDYVEMLHSLPVTGAPCEEVVHYGHPTRRPLIDEPGEAILLQHGLESCAYLPLLAGGTVVGILGLYGDESLYKEIDVVQLMPLGNQVGFAIANVRMYEDNYLERHRLSMVINSIAEGVVMCDRQGRIVLANQAAMALLNLDTMLLDQPLSEIPDFVGICDLEGNPLPIEDLPMMQALLGETFHDRRVLLNGPDDDYSFMSFSGAPVHDADNETIEGAVVIFRDITITQRLERAKDDFLAEAAHELRSPLGAVCSYAEMLLRRAHQRPESDHRDLHGLTILSQQVSHMLSLVDNLLDVSRLDAGQIDLQMQRVNLVSLAEQVLDQQRLTTTSCELCLEMIQPEIWVVCDSLRIQQVLTNLVSNAIKYSPPNRRVSVHVDLCSALTSGETAIERAGSETDGIGAAFAPLQGEAVVSVCDQGYGISPEHRARLFQRFYRARRHRAEGLGLGLYLSRHFVLMHGGTIDVESSEGQGSTFWFTLPLYEE
jgi:two-component system phosphate regulon sensor histidine kinase PhoR